MTGRPAVTLTESPERAGFLIVTGMYRSGTTLVQKLQDVNKEVAVINQGRR